ncbi:MAG TPA: hypothetical protein VK358_01045, partial [Longimicrobium sp.]|nr:hypothetical protein [Longimicrobium sp.]
GAQSPTLRVSCEADGRRGAVERGVLTRWRSRPGGGWGGPLGPSYPDRPWGWWEPAYPIFVYPDVNVVLR